jgi:hypothetical protein
MPEKIKSLKPMNSPTLPSPSTIPRHPYSDLHLVSGLGAFFLAIVYAASTITGWESGRAVSAIMFAFLAVGSAPLQFVEIIDWWEWLAITLGLGIGILVLTSFVLLEIGRYNPLVLGGIIGAIALSMHLVGIVRAARVRRS